MKFYPTFGLIILAALMANGCAKKPEAIAPAYVSHTKYAPWRCNQLAEELQRIESALATASGQQETARNNDIVGVLVLGIPVSSLSGDNIAPQIAQLKGDSVAIQKAMTLKGCAKRLMNSG